MKLFLIGLSLIIGSSCQIHTQIGKDGYKYPKPQARFNLPEPIEAEPACSNGGSGQFCCTNGAENVDCCENGGQGEFCCTNGANNKDCCTNGGSGPDCCTNGGSGPDCCTNGGLGPDCCTNGGSGPDCCTNGGSGPDCCTNGGSGPDCCTNGGSGQFCCTNGVDNPNCELPTPPPLPSFVPLPNLPKVIPLQPRVEPDEEIIVESLEPMMPLKPIEVSSPAPFVPAPLPVKPIEVLQIQPRNFEATTKSPNEYLPPFDVRSGETPDWPSWKAKYGKRYASPSEEKHRRMIFEHNVEKIVSHNTEFEAGLVAYDLDVNKFCDLTQDEFTVMHTGLKRDARSVEDHSTLNVFMPSPMLEMMVEDEVDWRKKGAVTPVKNQGSCASCWAFAANGALEAQNFLAKGKLVSLSEQNLIDCVKDNDGCDGGYMTNAYNYVRINPGVDTESSYPYEARNSTCRFDPANVGGECIAHMEIMIGNEKALQQAVATVGPVAAGIDGAKHSFQFYKSGYYYEPNCETEVNHAVVIVGYGKTEKGEEYWICKNSWDTDWGEEGYIRMARNKNNHCGITTLASYPLV